MPYAPRRRLLNAALSGSALLRLNTAGSAGLLAACSTVPTPAAQTAGSALAPAQIQAIAQSAYVWGYPSVDLHAILDAYALDPTSPQYKAPLNRIGHARRVASPDDTAVIAPNVDTPYSYAWLDLRAEPVVITLPSFEAERYLSLMLVDLYTWIVDYVTPRTNGRDGGHFMVAREAWSGPIPDGIRQVIRVPTDLALGMVRTQLLGPADLPRVHALQDSMAVRTLSEFLGRTPPRPLPLPARVTPLDLRREPTSPRFFEVLSWMLNFMPTLPEERTLRERFATLGVQAGAWRPPAHPQAREHLVAGEAEGLQKMGDRARQVRSSAELFGSRAFLADNYLTRATGAMLGILGNAAEEYLGVGYHADSTGQAFDGRHRYSIRFAPGGLPPVDAFWSLTVYDQARLLYANALGRHVINSPMLNSLQRDADGGITLHVQHDSPGPARESNWLPVPATPFGLTFRTYLPREPIRTGAWKAPAVVRVK